MAAVGVEAGFGARYREILGPRGEFGAFWGVLRRFGAFREVTAGHGAVLRSHWTSCLSITPSTASSCLSANPRREAGSALRYARCYWLSRSVPRFDWLSSRFPVPVGVRRKMAEVAEAVRLLKALREEVGPEIRRIYPKIRPQRRAAAAEPLSVLENDPKPRGIAPKSPQCGP